MLLECVEYLLGGSEKRLVLIISSAYRMKKLRQVGLLGEPGKLRCIVQSHIEQTLDAIGAPGSVAGPRYEEGMSRLIDR